MNKYFIEFDNLPNCKSQLLDNTYYVLSILTTRLFKYE